MTNYAHYTSTVEQVNRIILQESALGRHVPFLPISLTSVSQQQQAEYMLRGASRLAPLRQSAFRNNFSHWLTYCWQPVQVISDSTEQLLMRINDIEFPYPSQVNIDGIYLPCWVWGHHDAWLSISVIDRRTGHFSTPRNIEPMQLIDREQWLGAQVIDSVDESIETIHHYLEEQSHEQNQTQKQAALNEPTLTDAIRNPCFVTLSPIMSVGLTTVVILGFFLSVKWLLGF
ncbi:hypothetical protein [Photobacterium nomapromontoriensis]|uniref:hypothetical protein n=1 Tax=Photobacterium nomapromontoriensis TaxID=2910237 RepID=UPI003D145374